MLNAVLSSTHSRMNDFIHGSAGVCVDNLQIMEASEETNLHSACQRLLQPRQLHLHLCHGGLASPGFPETYESYEATWLTVVFKNEGKITCAEYVCSKKIHCNTCGLARLNGSTTKQKALQTTLSSHNELGIVSRLLYAHLGRSQLRSRDSWTHGQTLHIYIYNIL